jgi:hypothetical protein
MSEVAVVGNLENTELSRISVSREALYEEHAGAGVLNVDQIQGSFDQMQGVTVTEADSKLQQKKYAFESRDEENATAKCSS